MARLRPMDAVQPGRSPNRQMPLGGLLERMQAVASLRFGCGLSHNGDGDRPGAPNPSAGAVPGRCGTCLAADTHRPVFWFSVTSSPWKA